MVQPHQDTNAFVTLISVLIVGAMGSAIAVTLLLSGLAFSRSSLSIIQSYQAKALADVCAEEALQLVHDTISYSGSGNKSLGSGACTYTVTVGSGQNRTITTTGTVGNVIRKVTINITALTPLITISSWQEAP